MKKKWEVRYFVTAVASVPIYKVYGKTETYRQAAKDGWGTVCRDEKNNLFCDEDCSASLIWLYMMARQTSEKTKPTTAIPNIYFAILLTVPQLLSTPV